jgi:predicted transcriptional regulator
VPVPGWRKLQSADKCGEQPDIAHADRRRIDPENFRRFQCKDQALCVGGAFVFAAKLLDAGLQNFAAPAAAVAEDRAKIAVVRRAVAAFFDVRAADRDRDVRTLAKFAAGGVAEDKEAAAQLFARELEENLGGLHDRRLDARIAGALVEFYEGGGEAVLAVLNACRHGAGL